MLGVVDVMVEYMYKGDVKVLCCFGGGFCFNNMISLLYGENESDIVYI